MNIFLALQLLFVFKAVAAEDQFGVSTASSSCLFTKIKSKCNSDISDVAGISLGLQETQPFFT